MTANDGCDLFATAGIVDRIGFLASCETAFMICPAMRWSMSPAEPTAQVTPDGLALILAVRSARRLDVGIRRNHQHAELLQQQRDGSGIVQGDGRLVEDGADGGSADGQEAGPLFCPETSWRGRWCHRRPERSEPGCRNRDRLLSRPPGRHGCLVEAAARVGRGDDLEPLDSGWAGAADAMASAARVNRAVRRRILIMFLSHLSGARLAGLYWAGFGWPFQRGRIWTTHPMRKLAFPT